MSLTIPQIFVFEDEEYIVHVPMSMQSGSIIISPPKGRHVVIPIEQFGYSKKVNEFEIIIEERKNVFPEGKPYYYAILRYKGKDINGGLSEDKNLIIDMLTEYVRKECGLGDSFYIKITTHQKIEDENSEE